MKKIKKKEGTMEQKVKLRKTSDDLYSSCIDVGLCSHCGSCIGICPSSFLEAEKTRKGDIIINEAKHCIACGFCTSVCPGPGYPIKDHVEGYFEISSRNDTIKSGAASGGTISQILVDLFDQEKIDKALVVINNENFNQRAAKYIAAACKEDVLNARQSKYVQVSIGNALKQIKEDDCRYAVVGVPCQIYGISKAMELNVKLKKNIKYKIGLFCGYTYTEECFRGLSRYMGIKEDDIKSVTGWRQGGLPGNLEVLTNSKDFRCMSFQQEHAMDITFYAQNRCLLCKDCMADYADIAVGDIGNWRAKSSLVIIRTENGKEMLQISRNNLNIRKLDKAELRITTLPFMLREKRSKVSLREKEKSVKFKPNWNHIEEPRLYIADKIVLKVSDCIKKFGRRHIAFFLKHPKMMENVGEWGYTRMNRTFVYRSMRKIEKCIRREK